MKYIILGIMLLISNLPCFGTTITGYMIENTIFSDRVEHDVWPILTDKQDYATGGITFTYPAGYFAMAPTIHISLLQNTPIILTETFVSIVSTNSATSTTIMVYNVNSGVVSEAAPASVTVYLLATADIP